MRCPHAVTVLLVFSIAAPAALRAAPFSIKATGHDSRIDVVWQQRDPLIEGWTVWRASQPAGPFEQLRRKPQRHSVFSDFLGQNGRQFFYRVTGVRGDNRARR